MSDDVDNSISRSESYYEGLCRLLRYMVGKTTVSTERRTVQSEWTLYHTIGDTPPWLRGDNWMLPRHAADAIEWLRAERDEARREIVESLHPDLRDSYVAARGWDCRKENTDER